jgi:hypothetical protein
MLSIASTDEAAAEKLCLRSRTKVVNGFINLRNGLRTAGACPRGFTAVLDTDTFEGADGSLRIYGDGSAGALSVVSSTSLNTVDTQYTDVAIASGQTLTVPSGTVIRCTGTFTNEGTISVLTYAIGGRHGSTSTAVLTTQSGAAHPGIGASSASNGAFGDNSATVLGGGEAGGITEARARQILKPGAFGGGGGGAGRLSGASGGGTLTVLCKGAVVNNGTISAIGGSTFAGFGDGGGGGGIVILASQTSVTNSASGTISVAGSAGSASSAGGGAGGGGGGGWTHLLAPVINPSGTIDVAGGAAGSNGTAVTDSRRFGGGCGGSSFGKGGLGGAVFAPSTANAAIAGDPGLALESLTDPTSLF